MKKNFLVTTSLKDSWEFSENNFILGKWCEFYNFDIFQERKNKEFDLKDITITKNNYHWDDTQKKRKDYEYLKIVNEEVLDIVYKKLSKLHNLNENKLYWRIIIDKWLCSYISTIFERWENIRTFLKKNKNNKFYSNLLSYDDLDFTPKNNQHYDEFTQKDEWNHLIYLRILKFLKNENVILIKKSKNKLLKKNELNEREEPLNEFSVLKKVPPLVKAINQPLLYILTILDKLISEIAFKYNKVIFENFHFPKLEYFKLCLKCKLIPARYLNTFNFKVNSDESSVKNKKREEFENSFLNLDIKNNFVKFLLLNIHKDIPKSYLEDFKTIRAKIFSKAQKKKIIFSMYSLYFNDNFKIYLAETKKIGSKLIVSKHGAGPTFSNYSFSTNDPYFNFLEKISDKIIKWENQKPNNDYENIFKKDNFRVELSPTLPIIKFKRKNTGNLCTIIFYEAPTYMHGIGDGPGLEATAKQFGELCNLVQKLNPQIKSNVKFRLKEPKAFNPANKFSKLFGFSSTDKVSTKNSYIKTLLNSKLIINTAPTTTFLEALYSNTPTILIYKKNEWAFSKKGLEIVNIFKENKIIFNDIDSAVNHINANWSKLDLWWNSENVQFAKDLYLKNYFNVRPNWFGEWSDHINFLLSTK